MFSRRFLVCLCIISSLISFFFNLISFYFLLFDFFIPILKKNVRISRRSHKVPHSISLYYATKLQIFFALFNSFSKKNCSPKTKVQMHFLKFYLKFESSPDWFQIGSKVCFLKFQNKNQRIYQKIYFFSSIIHGTFI